jgi:hypothetical protein
VDHHVTKAEFVAVEVSHHMPMHMAELAFMMMDMNHDGMITVMEFHTIFNRIAGSKSHSNASAII